MMTMNDINAFHRKLSRATKNDLLSEREVYLLQQTRYYSEEDIKKIIDNLSEFYNKEYLLKQFFGEQK